MVQNYEASILDARLVSKILASFRGSRQSDESDIKRKEGVLWKTR